MNGEFAQVFGALRSVPTRIPGTFDSTIKLRYGGYADFQANDQCKGELDLYAALRSPFLPCDCTIGDLAHPIHSVVQQVGANEVVSPDPLTVKFAVRDTRFAMPGVTGCGPWSRAVDHRLGLPSPAGRNFFEQTTYVRFRAYPPSS